MDDLFSNVCGAALGLPIYRTFEKFGGNYKQAEKWMSELLIIAGFIGCFMAAVPAAKSPIDVKVAKEFQFTITSVTAFDSELVLSWLGHWLCSGIKIRKYPSPKFKYQENKYSIQRLQN